MFGNGRGHAGRIRRSRRAQRDQADAIGAELDGELTPQPFDGRAGHAKSAAGHVGLARHLRGEREDHAAAALLHVAGRGSGGDEVGAHGVVDGQRECLARHRRERLTLVAAEADEIEGDVDGAGRAHHLVEMFFDGGAVERIDGGGGRAGTGL